VDKDKPHGGVLGQYRVVAVSRQTAGNLLMEMKSGEHLDLIQIVHDGEQPFPVLIAREGSGREFVALLEGNKRAVTYARMVAKGNLEAAAFDLGAEHKRTGKSSQYHSLADPRVASAYQLGWLSTDKPPDEDDGSDAEQQQH
jgi:hypothetical protein